MAEERVEVLRLHQRHPQGTKAQFVTRTNLRWLSALEHPTIDARSIGGAAVFQRANDAIRQMKPRMEFRYVIETHDDVAVGGASDRKMIRKGIPGAFHKRRDPPIPRSDTVAFGLNCDRAVLDVARFVALLLLKDRDRPPHKKAVGEPFAKGRGIIRQIGEQSLYPLHSLTAYPSERGTGIRIAFRCPILATLPHMWGDGRRTAPPFGKFDAAAPTDAACQPTPPADLGFERGQDGNLDLEASLRADRRSIQLGYRKVVLNPGAHGTNLRSDDLDVRGV